MLYVIVNSVVVVVVVVINRVHTAEQKLRFVGGIVERLVAVLNVG